MKKGILIIGSLNMDISVDMIKMPVVGETVLGQAISYEAGGKGANQACAAGKLGGNVHMLGCIGHDESGKKLIESLTAAGVETKYLKKSEEHSTGTAIINVDSNGANSIVVIPGANICCDIEYLKAEDDQFKWCDYVMIQMEIPHEAVWYAIKRAKELGKTVILNPAPAPKSISREIFNLIDYITPNETELATLSGIPGTDLESVKVGARTLINWGVHSILITLGERGAMLVGTDDEKVYPARKVKSVDTTAAGDCFNGAFVSALAEGKEVEEAISYANLASSIAVTRKGAQESLPERDELEWIIKNYSK